jgi:hypothetical protein
MEIEVQVVYDHYGTGVEREDDPVDTSDDTPLFDIPRRDQPAPPFDDEAEPEVPEWAPIPKDPPTTEAPSVIVTEPPMLKRDPPRRKTTPSVVRTEKPVIRDRRPSWNPFSNLNLRVDDEDALVFSMEGFLCQLIQYFVICHSDIDKICVLRPYDKSPGPIIINVPVQTMKSAEIDKLSGYIGNVTHCVNHTWYISSL